MNIVVTGSIAFDYVMAFPGHFADHIIPEQISSISVSFLVDSLKRQRGGVAPNIAYTLALLGGKPRIMATAGHDFGEYRHALEECGVDTGGIVTFDHEFTASFFANTDLAENQIGFFYTGAMAKARQLTFAAQAPDADLAIISPNDPQAMRAHVRECKARHIQYVYDPSQQTIRLSAEDIDEGVSGCYLLTVNEYELGMIQEKTGWTKADIHARCGGIVVTRGKRGSDIYIDGREYHIPTIPPHEVREPTGAGDAFRAGLLRGIQLGLPWPVIGRIGALCGTYVLEHVGTQNHYFDREAFIARYRQHFDDEGALDTLLE